MNWDLLGYSEPENTWVLCEVKAHIGELHSACGATEASLEKIKLALDKTKAQFNSTSANDWSKKYYQFANRLYCLDVMQRSGLKAKLLNIYFVGDRCDESRKSPQTQSEWENPIAEMYAYLGIDKKTPDIHSLFLSVDGTGT